MRNDKSTALKLRLQGESYNEIYRKLKIPKSTLSYWFSKDPEMDLIKNKNITQSKKIWAKNITAYNKTRAKQIEQQWMEKQRKTANEIKPFNQYTLKLMGAALYWAEGFKKTKYAITFCNSDPDMIVLMMKFFREICEVDESKMKAQVQIHPNVSEKDAKLYWSKISNIPLENFRKSLTTISVSSKRKRNPHTLPFGTFRIHIHDVRLVNRMKGWIIGLIKNT